MKITIISIFPDFIESFKTHSIIKNAINKKLLTLETVNPRDFAVDGRVDDYVFGGGDGMLLLIEPFYKALMSVKTPESYTIFLTPGGVKLKQPLVKQLVQKKHIIILCGHYEGIDSRIKNFIDLEISLGEYILTGGEIAAAVLTDSITRLIPGVIKENSHVQESFENDKIEYDQFSKPRNFMGYEVPEVLLNGNHKNIAQWREKNSYNNTMEFLKKNKEK